MPDIALEKRLRVAHSNALQKQREMAEAAARRDRAAQALRDAGYSLAQIAALLGVDRRRVLQYTGAKNPRKPAETAETP